MNWCYMAGFFDGEGTVQPKGQHNGCSLQLIASMVQVERKVLDDIAEFLAAHGIASTIRTELRNNPKWRTCYRLDIKGRRESVCDFLRSMLPFLIVKKVIAQDCLRYAKLFPSRAGMAHVWGHRDYSRGWYRKREGLPRRNFKMA
jgi:hypothetical protein